MPGHDFPLIYASIDLTGWATLALAVATFLAVVQGKRATKAAVQATAAAVKEARATENLATQSGEQLRRSYLPILLPVNVSISMTSGGPLQTTIGARIENVGTGPALNIVMDIVWPDGKDRPIVGGQYRHAVVPAGGVYAFGITYAQQIPIAFAARLSFRDSFRRRYFATCQIDGGHMSDVVMAAVDDAGDTLEAIVE